MEKNGLHLPEDSWKCLNCGAEWMAEYDAGETPQCHRCNSTDIQHVNAGERIEIKVVDTPLKKLRKKRNPYSGGFDVNPHSEPDES